VSTTQQYYYNITLPSANPFVVFVVNVLWLGVGLILKWTSMVFGWMREGGEMTRHSLRRRYFVVGDTTAFAVDVGRECSIAVFTKIRKKGTGKYFQALQGTEIELLT
jgi:hypothetical protein